MALDLEDEFGSRATPASSDYPFGSAKNISVAGANDGTPVVARLVNDWLGFFQKLLSNAGITPSGNPDTVNASDYFTGMQKAMGLPYTGRMNTNGLNFNTFENDGLSEWTDSAVSTAVNTPDDEPGILEVRSFNDYNGHLIIIQRFTSISGVFTRRADDGVWSPWVNTNNLASETVDGLIQIATAAEAAAKTNDTTALTPLKLNNAFNGANQDVTGTDGFQDLPGGLIIQWMKISVAANTAGLTFPLPKAFPNNFFNVQATHSYVSGTPSGVISVYASPSGLNNVIVFYDYTDNILGDPRDVYIYAIGN